MGQRPLTCFAPLVHGKPKTIIRAGVVIKPPDEIRDVCSKACGCTRQRDKKHAVVVNGPYGGRALSAMPAFVGAGTIARAERGGKAAQKVKPSLAILPKGDLYGAVYDAPLVEGKPRIKRNCTVPGEVVHNDRGMEMRDDLDWRRGAGVDDVDPEVGAGQMKVVNFGNTTCMSGVASGCKEAAVAMRLDKLQQRCRSRGRHIKVQIAGLEAVAEKGM